jgi:putative salt-induced outer membrane protein YdiY
VTWGRYGTTEAMLYARICPAVVALAAIGLASPARAGIVNVQSILATEADEGLSGAIAGSADWRTGNTELLVLSASPVARYRRGNHLFIGIVRGELGRSKGQRIISKTFEHLRYRHRLSPRLTAEVFTQHEYDRFRRLELRALVGAGPVLHLLRGEEYRLSWGVAYMIEYEELRGDELPDAGEDDLAHRASTYLTGTYELDERVQFIETIYVQPRLTDASDIRLLNDSQIVFKITEDIALTTAFSLAWDNAPPQGIEQLDTSLKSSITYTF